MIARRLGSTKRANRGISVAVAIAAGLAAGAARADEIVLPAPSVEEGQSFDLAYRLDEALSGNATLDIEWTDIDGRAVERRRVDVVLDHQSAIPFSIDTRRAVVRRNTLSVRVSLAGGADLPPQERAASIDFIALPPGTPWSDYQIIEWQTYPRSAYQLLKGIGISAGMTHADRGEPGRLVLRELEPLLRNDLPWYVENIATDFYSEYHRWFPDHPVNWRFTEAQRRYRVDPQDPAVLQRSPSLSDKSWLSLVHDRVKGVVATHRRFRPLFYDLADEPGIGDLLMFWDFDLSAPSLRGFRQWLQQQYPTLEALNRQWGSAFARWDDVVPMTTPQAMERVDGNISGWSDFKEWMDVAFANAFRVGRDAVHEADPNALAALEGGQSPGWGGWNYAHLADAVDLMEIYDDGGGNLDIARSLNPALVLLTTGGGEGPAEERRVWREWLRGTRGLIIYDEARSYVAADGGITARGRAAMAYYQALRGGLGAQLINARRTVDPIAILYSPASLRTRWLLDWKQKGDGWTRLDPDGAAAENAPRQASMRGFLRGLELAGLTPRMLASRQLAEGALDRDGTRILILPETVALSSDEVVAIRRFAERGGTIVADGVPGRFDEHGRPLAAPALADLFATGAAGENAVFWTPPASLAQATASPGPGPGPNDIASLRALLVAHGVTPAYALTDADGAPTSDVARYVFTDGDVALIGLQRDGAAKATGDVTLSLPEPSFVYDLRGGRALGRVDKVALALDPVSPTVLAVSPRALPAPTIAGPSALHLGETGEYRVALAGGRDAALHVLRLDIVDPVGEVSAHYSGNLLAPGGEASGVLPLALNDQPGTWQIRVTDIVSGQTATQTVTVE
jgi:hypothetical protein